MRLLLTLALLGLLVPSLARAASIRAAPDLPSLGPPSASPRQLTPRTESSAATEALLPADPQAASLQGWSSFQIALLEAGEVSLHPEVERARVRVLERANILACVFAGWKELEQRAAQGRAEADRLLAAAGEDALKRRLAAPMALAAVHAANEAQSYGAFVEEARAEHRRACAALVALVLKRSRQHAPSDTPPAVTPKKCETSSTALYWMVHGRWYRGSLPERVQFEERPHPWRYCGESQFHPPGSYCRVVHPHGVTWYRHLSQPDDGAPPGWRVEVQYWFP